MGGRCIGHSVLDIAGDSIPDLNLEIIQIKGIQPMEFDEIPVIVNLEADGSSDSHGDTEIRKAGIVDVEIGNAELNLDDPG